MKLAMFSDSHGYTVKMMKAIENASPDLIIHLGDGGVDVEKIKKQFPLLPLKAVKGNCDFSSELPETDLFSISGKKIFLTHGHLFGVKNGTEALVSKAEKLGADIVMFGHTHVADYFKSGNLHVLNPGSCSFSTAASYAEVIITDMGDIFCRIVRL